MKPSLTPEQLEAIRRLDSCTVANAIETFETRLRNEGFADARIRCLFPQRSPMLGYAVTVKIRCSPPTTDGRSYLDRTDWWNYILTIPAPGVVVLQDVDPNPGTGSLLGEVHANILLALDCVGAVTAVEKAGFHFFAGSLAVSHAYAHIVEIGGEVEVDGLKVQAGDLIHGDVHGILSIPEPIAAEIPAVAKKILAMERKLIALCRSENFSLEKLRAAVRDSG